MEGVTFLPVYGDLETALPLLLERLDEAVTQCERGLITSTEADCRLAEEVERAASDLAEGPMGCAPATLRLVPLLVGRVQEWADGRLCEDPETATDFRHWLGEWRDWELRRHRRFAETSAALDALFALGNRELVAVELERLRLLGTEAN